MIGIFLVTFLLLPKRVPIIVSHDRHFLSHVSITSNECRLSLATIGIFLVTFLSLPTSADYRQPRLALALHSLPQRQAGEELL